MALRYSKDIVYMVSSGFAIGMGSVVIRDVPGKVVVAGNPAKIIKERDENTKALQ